MNSYGYVNVINLPTFISPITGRAESCLDHVWHNQRETCASFVLQPAIWDHYAVARIFNAWHNNDRIQIVFRDFSESNTQKFESNVTNVFDNCVLPRQNDGECARYLDKFLCASMASLSYEIT